MKGILDPEGKNKNPLTGEEYSDKYKELAKIWSKFPAYKGATDIINDIKKNQVILVVSGTGSGKTVLLPKYALHAYDYKGKIAITLPKQLLTKSAAEFSALTLDVDVGEHIGYKYRGSPREMVSDNNKLLYATDGTIVARLLNDPILKDFDAVIVDEAHERKVQIDFLLYLLRNAVRNRPDFKVIIMSATINSSLFASYFSEFKFKEINIGSDTHYPIKDIYLDEPITKKDYINKGLDIILKLINEDDPEKPGSHDILFFITSANEALDLCKKLQAHLQSQHNDFSKLTCQGDVFCVEVFAGMSPRSQELAQDKVLYKQEGKYSRKVVVATNVAESSLTIDGIKYVIDSGFELHSSYDPINRARRLDLDRITLAQAKQRKGRTGRTEPGVCYHLYTRKEEELMKKYPEPDIRTSNISDEILRLLNNVHSIQKLLNILSEFIEPPKEDYIKTALDELIQLGAINDNDNITELGKIMSNMSGSPATSLGLIYSRFYNCQHEVSKIYATIEASKANMNDLFILPTKILQKNTELKTDKEKYKQRLNSLNDKFDAAKKYFYVPGSDHLCLLNLYEKYSEKYKSYEDSPEKLRDWCYKYFVKSDSMKKARKYRKRIRRDLAVIGRLDAGKLGIEINDDIIKSDINKRIIYCLSEGYRLQRASLQKDYYQTKYSKDLKLELSQDTFLKIDPKEIIYHEIFISMGNASINIVSKI